MSFKSAADFREGIIRVWKHGFQPGASTGWPNLDRLYTVRESEFTVVTGMPGHGKSEFMASLMINLARLHGWRMAVVSPENQPTERFAARLIEKYTEELMNDDEGKPKMSEATFEAGYAWLVNHFAFYDLEQDESPLPKRVFKDLDAWQATHGKASGLLLDPYNEFDHSRAAQDARLSETEYISGFLSHLRRSARTRQLHLWLVAHPTKQQSNEDGFCGPVGLYAISGSAHFRNKADNGLSVYRNDLEGGGNYTTVFVQKVRFREIGQPGVAYFTFDELTGAYHQHKPKEK